MEFEKIESRPVFMPDEQPNVQKWSLPTLFKKSSKGKLMSWKISFDGENLETIHGYVGGSLQYDVREVKTNKSGRTIDEQGWLEGKSAWEKKKRKNYSLQQESSGYFDSFEPMLATKFDEKYMNPNVFPVALQPKLDGVRLISYIENDEVVFRTRGNKKFVFLQSLREEVKLILDNFPPYTILDGELYVHGWKQNEIRSAASRLKDQSELEGKLEYHIFDISIREASEMVFIERFNLLIDVYNSVLNDISKISLVEVILVWDIESIYEHQKRFIENGYEGAIVRFLDRPYVFGRRSNTMFKVKSFFEEEAIIEVVWEASGREKGLAMFTVRDMENHQFNVRMKGSFEQRKEWLENADQLIGKKITFRYAERGPNGIPIQPIGVDFRDEFDIKIIRRKSR